LLKIVEEPPEHLIFVFATTEPEKVLPTIRSRTHHYPFRLLAPRTMRALIERICAGEGVSLDDAVYPLVIRAGGGSPRDTLSVLDQLLAGAEGGVTYAQALGLLGATDVALIDDAVDALSAGDAAALFGAVESVIDAGHDPRRFATDLLERFRDLIVLQAVPDAAARGVVDAPGDVLDRMRDQAAQIGTATLTRYAEVVHAGLGEMRGATAPRLLLEVICARLLLPSASDTESALLARIERIENRLDLSIPAGVSGGVWVGPMAPVGGASGAVSGPSVAPVGGDAASVVRPAAPVGGDADVAASVRRKWTTVMEKVRERSRTLDVMLAGAVVRAVDGNTLVLMHQSAPLAKRLAEQRNAAVIEDVLKDALGVAWRVRYEVAGDEPAPQPIADPAVEAQRAEEDSMLAEAESDGAPDVPRRDPEEAAVELLQNELGARRIDG